MNSHGVSRGLLVAGVLWMASYGSLQAQEKAGALTTPQMEQVVHNYILAHPEVVLEAVRSYDQKLKAAAKDRVRDTVKQNLDELYGHSPAFTSEDKSAEQVTLVEFFDYRCGYCKKVEDTVVDLAKKPGVRIVYKDLPILGPESLAAAHAALAADKQGGYEKFHHALLAAPPNITEDSIAKIAAEVGLDVARLKQDMKSPEIEQILNRNRQLANKLNIQSTPTFIVGTELVSGALPPQTFQSLINSARRPATAATPKAQQAGGL